MSARHQNTHGVIVKGAQQYGRRNRYETGKIPTTQDNIIPPLIPAKGGAGAGLGSGTSFPILYPEINLGNQQTEIIIQLGKPTSHYQKLSIIEETDPINVSFVGLIKGRATLFTLDITIDTPSLPTINWPAELQDLPDLPTDEGARYILHIVGFRDADEEVYYVINSTGGSGSNLWSDITIDVDKNMQNKELENLKAIFFHVSTGGEPEIGNSGNPNELDFYLNGIRYMDIYRNQTAGYEGQGVLEVYGNPTTGYIDTSPSAAVKLVSNDATPTTSQVIGEYGFDAYNGSIVRKTFAALYARMLTITNNNEDGQLLFNIIHDGTNTTYLELNGLLDEIYAKKKFIALDDIQFGDDISDLIIFNGRTAGTIQPLLDQDAGDGLGATGHRFLNGWITTIKDSATKSYGFVAAGWRADLPTSSNYEFYVNSVLAAAINLTNLDMNSSYIQRVNYIRFDGAGSGFAITDYFVASQSDTRLLLHAPAGKSIGFSFGGDRVGEMTVSTFRPNADAEIGLGDPTHAFLSAYIYNIEVKDYIWIQNTGLNPTVDGMIRNNGGDVIVQSGAVDRNLSDPTFDSLIVSGAAFLNNDTIIGATLSDFLTVEASTVHNASFALPVVSKSGGYTLTAQDCMIRCTSSGNQTMALPTAVGITGRIYMFYKTQATGTVTIDANGSQTIDGALTQTISTQYGIMRIMSDGANWMII